FASSSFENWMALPNLSSLIPVHPETRTDEDGRFTFPGLGRDRIVHLTVTAKRVIETHFTAMTRSGPDVAVRPTDASTPAPRADVIHATGFTQQLMAGRTIA